MAKTLGEKLFSSRKNDFSKFDYHVEERAKTPHEVAEPMLSKASGTQPLTADEIDVAKAAISICAAHQAATDTHRIVSLIQHCESPIERVFAIALYTYAVEMAYDERPAIRLSEFTIGGGVDSFITIRPQAQIGDFRVDFAVSSRETYPDWGSDGTEKEPTIKVRTKTVVVECDGHDFHERTKEQAAKDRSRDRTLQSVGYAVFRFTGSEIWKDPWKCAREVITHLTDWEVSANNQTAE